MKRFVGIILSVALIMVTILAMPTMVKAAEDSYTGTTWVAWGVHPLDDDNFYTLDEYITLHPDKTTVINSYRSRSLKFNNGEYELLSGTGVTHKGTYTITEVN